MVQNKSNHNYYEAFIINKNKRNQKRNMDPRFYYFRKLKSTIHYWRTTKLFNVLFLTTFIVPLLLLIIGAINYDECPMEPLIPKWLIAGAIVIFFSHVIQLTINAMNIYSIRIEHQNQRLNKVIKNMDYLEGAGHALTFGWLIGATMLAVPYKSTVNYDPKTGGENYCNRRCFEFIFIKPIIMWSLLALVLIIAISSIIYGFIKPSNTDISMTEHFANERDLKN